MSEVAPPPAAAHESEKRTSEIGRQIVAALEGHAPQEAAALQAYQQILDEVDDPAIRMLVEAVLDDERRHHALITDMVAIARATFDLEADPAAPRLVRRVDPPLREATDRLLDFERHDAEELRELQRLLRDVPESSMLPLLVETMYLDTAKHIEILKTIRHHVVER